jgi:hypothetical protein
MNDSPKARRSRSWDATLARGTVASTGDCGSPVPPKKSTARKVGKLGNVGNVTRFPVFFAVFRSKVTWPTIATLAN